MTHVPARLTTAEILREIDLQISRLSAARALLRNDPPITMGQPQAIVSGSCTSTGHIATPWPWPKKHEGHISIAADGTVSTARRCLRRRVSGSPQRRSAAGGSSTGRRNWQRGRRWRDASLHQARHQRQRTDLRFLF
jgi:hypothetical protein